MYLISLEFFKKLYGDNLPGISLLDVGVSGGIDERWRVFGKKLSGIGVDPLIAEVERLTMNEKNAKFLYLAAFVAWKKWNDVCPDSVRFQNNNDSFSRTSASRAAKQIDYTKEKYNAGKKVVYSDKYLEIDELVQLTEQKRVDFIKTDTDGFDFPTLCSGDKTLSSNQVLGLFVECNFHGADHPYANNFANIDRYARSKGFTLFDLSSYRYSRSVFPDKFVYEIPAQTRRGSVQWADALYFRDFCHPEFENIAGWSPSNDQLIRAIMILEMLGQFDSAAELLIKFSEPLGITAELNVVLDKFVSQYGDSKLGSTYAELIANFENDHTSFYP